MASGARNAVVALAAAMVISVLAYSVVLWRNESMHVNDVTDPSALHRPTVAIPQYLEELVFGDASQREPGRLLRDIDPTAALGLRNTSTLGVSMLVSLIASGPMLECNETLRNRWHDKHYDDDGNFDPILERYREKGPQKAGWNDHAFHATMEMTRVLWSLGIPAVQSGGNVLGWRRGCGIVEITTDVDLMADWNMLRGEDHFNEIIAALGENGFSVAKQHGTPDLPGVELRFWYRSSMGPSVVADLFFFGWRGTELFTNIYSPKNILRCPWTNHGFATGDWDGHRIVVPGSSYDDVHEYLVGKYKPEYLDLAPKTHGYIDCIYTKPTDCTAYDSECNGPLRVPFIAQMIEYVADVSRYEQLRFYIVGSAFEVAEGRKPMAPGPDGVVVFTKDLRAWSKALLTRDRTAGLSTYVITFGDGGRDVDHTEGPPLALLPCHPPDNAGSLSLFATIRFSAVSPVALRLYATDLAFDDYYDDHGLRPCAKRATGGEHCPGNSTWAHNFCAHSN